MSCRSPMRLYVPLCKFDLSVIRNAPARDTMSPRREPYQPDAMVIEARADVLAVALASISMAAIPAMAQAMAMTLAKPGLLFVNARAAVMLITQTRAVSQPIGPD